MGEHTHSDRHAGALRDATRLAVLARTGLLDDSAGVHSTVLDRVSRLAARAIRAPVAQVNLVTDAQQVPVSAFAAPVAAAVGVLNPDVWRRAVGLEDSLCQHVVVERMPLSIPDTRLDVRSAHSLATTRGGIGAYLGAPVVAPAGEVLGSVCVVDFAPRAWTGADLELIEECAALAADEIAARLAAADALAAATHRVAQTEHTLDVLLEHVPEGITIADGPDARIARVSRYGRELAGQALESLLDIPADLHPAVWGVFHADGRTPAQPDELPLTRAARHGETVRGEEWVLRRPDGRQVTVLCNAAPIRDSAGAVTGGLLAWRDIDDRKQRERALERLQHFATAISIPQRTEELARVIADEFAEVLGTPTIRVTRRSPDDPARMEVLAAVGFDGSGWSTIALESALPAAEALSTGMIVHVQGRDAVLARDPRLAETPDGDEVVAWLSLPLRVGSDDAPVSVGAVGAAFRQPPAISASDEAVLINLGRMAAQALERVSTMERLRAREHFLHTITEVAPSLLYVYSLVERRTIWSNAALTHLLGYTVEQVRAMGSAVLPTLMHADDFARYPAHAERLLGLPDGEVAEFAYRMRRQDGDWCWLESRDMVFSRTADGATREIVGAATDISERVRRLEVEQAARESAERASRAKGHFLATMSHELRTPLQAIQGHTQVMQVGVHGPTTDAQAAALARVQVGVKHMTTLITDVLQYATLEAGQITYALEPVDVGALLPTLRAMVGPQQQSKQLRWTDEIPDGSAVVMADRERLTQILLNLLSNAVKFTPAGGEIRVLVRDAEPTRGWTTIDVIDTGVGIAADRLEAIFDPFAQEPTARAQTGVGSGLGLTISRDLARGMGGELVAMSEPGAGSTLRLTLPSAADQPVGPPHSA